MCRRLASVYKRFSCCPITTSTWLGGGTELLDRRMTRSEINRRLIHSYCNCYSASVRDEILFRYDIMPNDLYDVKPIKNLPDKWSQIQYPKFLARQPRRTELNASIVLHPRFILQYITDMELLSKK